MTPLHQPVLLDHVVEVLDPQPGQIYLDGTAGYGGHASVILERIRPSGRGILVDRDAVAVRHLIERFGDGVDVLHMDYLEAADHLIEDGTMVDLILLDLGVSSPQLDVATRGFSFKADAPLDMRMDQSQSLTAADVVNHYDERELEQLIREYGEEHRSRAVARAIVQGRPFTTTMQLAKAIKAVVGSAGKIDPSTRTFQAIRIEVNAELEQLREALPKLVQLLNPDGRLAVITFHSLEDRIVKQFFDRESRDCICPPKQPICTCDHHAQVRSLLSKPISGATDDVNNPRARSAKLRSVKKLKP